MNKDKGEGVNLMGKMFLCFIMIFSIICAGCSAQDAILLGGTAIVAGPLAAGAALVGGTVAGVSMAAATTDGEEQNQDRNDKWRAVDGWKGVDPKALTDWVLPEYKSRKKTDKERDMLYLAFEYRVMKGIPYPDAQNPEISVEEIRAKFEEYDLALGALEEKERKKYTFAKHLAETPPPADQASIARTQPATSGIE
jgi:hypothetical protein